MRAFTINCRAAREAYSKRLLDIDAQRNSQRSINFRNLNDPNSTSKSDIVEGAIAEMRSRSNYDADSANAAAQFKRDVQSAADVAAREALRAL